MFNRMLIALVVLPVIAFSYDQYRTYYNQRQYPQQQQQQQHGRRTENHVTLESLAVQLRDVRREVAESRRESREFFNTLQHEFSCEVKEIRQELASELNRRDRQRVIESKSHARADERPRENVSAQVANSLKEFEKKIKRGLKKITEQGEEIMDEMRSQKAELFAVRNSVYDARQEIIQKNLETLRGVQEANDTFVCYMHALRKKLYQVNNNLATVMREQQMLLDSIQRLEYTPEAKAMESGYIYDQTVADDNVHDEPTPSGKFLPGCTKNPLETQETLETFGTVFTNETAVTPDSFTREYESDGDSVGGEGKKASRKIKIGTRGDVRNGYNRHRAGLDSLFPTKAGDCQENPETYLEYPPMPRDCLDVYDLGFVDSGVYRIQPPGLTSQEVKCDQDVQEGGWTVILVRRNVPKHISFNRTWNAYEVGFGEPTREYWLGLETLHSLTSERSYTLRADMEDWEERSAWATYSSFSVAGPYERYRLRVSGYSGTAGDSMRHSHLQMFSTVDNDNDQENWGSCAQSRGGGGWWWGRCSCTQPTGEYTKGRYQGTEKGITWWHWKNSNYPLKTLTLKIKPVE